MRWIRGTTVVLAGAALGISLACSNDSTGTGGAVSLAGSYGLVSLFYVVPTTSTGTLQFTDNTFTANIHVTFPIDSMIILAGGYAAKHTSVADSIYLTLPTPLPQIPGTFQIKGPARDTLVLNLPFSSGGTTTSLVTTWKKQ